MGSFGGYYKGEKKKIKRERLEKEAEKIKNVQYVPKVEIIGKKRGK